MGQCRYVTGSDRGADDSESASLLRNNHCRQLVSKQEMNQNRIAICQNECADVQPVPDLTVVPFAFGKRPSMEHGSATFREGENRSN